MAKAISFSVTTHDQSARIDVTMTIDVQALTRSKEDTLHAILLALPKSTAHEVKRWVKNVRKEKGIR